MWNSLVKSYCNALMLLCYYLTLLLHLKCWLTIEQNWLLIVMSWYLHWILCLFADDTGKATASHLGKVLSQFWDSKVKRIPLHKMFWPVLWQSCFILIKQASIYTAEDTTVCDEICIYTIFHTYFCLLLGHPHCQWKCWVSSENWTWDLWILKQRQYHCLHKSFLGSHDEGWFIRTHDHANCETKTLEGPGNRYGLSFFFNFMEVSFSQESRIRRHWNSLVGSRHEKKIGQ